MDYLSDFVKGSRKRFFLIVLTTILIIHLSNRTKLFTLIRYYELRFVSVVCIKKKLGEYTRARQ